MTKKKRDELSTKDTEQRANRAIEVCLMKSMVLGLFVVSLGMVLPEIVLANGGAKFDLDAGVAAATTPLIDGLKAHWGKGVLLAGGASALIGEGDLRQKAIKAAIGCGVSGGVVLALIAMLT